MATVADDSTNTKVMVGEGLPPEPEVGTPDNPSRRVLTLANAITFTRLVLTFVFLYVFVLDINHTAAVVIYIIASVTDWLDGNIARATKTVSWVGKILDPIVDRALLFTGVLALVLHGELPLWMAMVLVGRDVSLIIGTEYLKTFTSHPLNVMYMGKLATALLMVGFSLLLIGTPPLEPLGILNVPYLPLLNETPSGIGIVFVYPGLVLSVVQAVRYWRKGFRVRDAILEGREVESW